MTIKSITDRVDQLPDMEPPVPGTSLPEPIAYPEGGTPTGESVEVAGIGSKFLGEILEPLTRKGRTAEKAVRVIDEKTGKKKTLGLEPPATVDDKVQPVAPPITPQGPGPQAIPPTPTKIEAPAPVTGQRLMEQAAERERLIREGKTEGAASPTPTQAAAGVTETPISTVAFDNDSMQATIRAHSERVLTSDPTVSVRSVYARAINAGVPEEQFTRVLQGIDMESKIGGSELAKNVAGLIELHDQSAKQLDDLFNKMAANQLDDKGKLQLRQQMASHDLVVKSLKGVQVDVARSMNAFKRVQDAGPGFRQLDLRKMLDDAGGDDALYKLSLDYTNIPGRAGRNNLLEAGLGKRTREAWFYTYQAQLLTNIESHAYNLVANALQLSAAPVERTVAVAIGKTRQAFKVGSDDRYYMDDVLARMSGLRNGILDGLQLAAHTAKTGARATAKGEVRPNAISAEAFSNVPVKTGNIVAGGLDVASMGVTGLTTGVPLPVSPMIGGLADFGKQVWKTPDITNSWVGKGVDFLGHMVGLPFRALSTADEFTGGIAARMQLHEEAWRFANSEYDKLLASGMTHDDAMKETVRQVGALLRERPKTLSANVEKYRKQSQFADTLDRSTPLGRGYWKLDEMFQNPLLKVHLPFAKTITQVFIEGSARTPGLNFISPRFWDDYNKGGRHRDLAIARVSAGGMVSTAFAMFAMEGRMTGSGPSDKADLMALEKQGYQKRSFVFRDGELSDENANTLQTSGLAKVSRGTGSLQGLYFVSFDRLQPISMAAAIGADFGDAMKFYTGPLDATGQFAWATAAASAQYMQDLPAVQGVGEVVSILRSRQEDGGQRVVDMFSRLGRQYADFLFTGVPVVGLAGSPGSAALERLYDPTIRSGGPIAENVPTELKFLYEQRQRLMSRIPGISKNIEPELDYLGREQKASVSPLELWVNYAPTMRVSVGKESAADQALASIDHGISRARDRWDGVNLTAQQYNRYKKLYGQDIKLPGSDGVERSLEKAIPFELKAAQDEAIMSGNTFLKGDQQKFVDRLVSTYRRMAKIRMIGFDPDPETGQSDIPSGEEMGLIGDKIEFPELANNIRKNKDMVRRQGK